MMYAVPSGSTAALRRCSSASRRRPRRRAAAPRQSSVPGMRRIGEQNDAREQRAASTQRAGSAAQPGQQLFDHRQVVDAVGAVGGDQRRRVRLHDDVGHVAGAKAGVDRHQHGADLGDGEEEEDVLGPIAEPQADVIARCHARRDQRLRGAVDLVAQRARTTSAVPRSRAPRARPSARRRDRSGRRTSAFEPHGSGRVRRCVRRAGTILCARQLRRSGARRSRSTLSVRAPATIGLHEAGQQPPGRIVLAGATQAQRPSLRLPRPRRRALARGRPSTSRTLRAVASASRARPACSSVVEAPPRRVARTASRRRAPGRRGSSPSM